MLLYNLTDTQVKLMLLAAWDLGHAAEAKSYRDSIEQRHQDLEAAFPTIFKNSQETLNSAELPIKENTPIDLVKHPSAAVNPHPNKVN